MLYKIYFERSNEERLSTSIQTRMTKSDLSPYFFYSADQQMKELITRLIQTNSKLQNYLNKDLRTIFI